MPWAAKQHRARPKPSREFGPNAAERGYDAKWRKARRWFLNRNQFCRECEKNGRLSKAVVVDHVVPHKGDKTLFWDVNNWQGLCVHCHNCKSVKE